MRFSQLECFTTLAEELHFGRAAHRLTIAPSNLSQQIRLLERDLGVQLFERTSRRVHLSPAGRALVGTASRILEDLDELHSTAGLAASGEAGTLTLSYCYGIGELVTAWTQTFRSAAEDVTIVSDERSTQQALDDVRSGAASLGVSRATAADVEVLEVDRRPTSVLLVPTGHRLERSSTVRLRDLHGEPYLMIDRSLGAEFHDELVEFFHRHGVQPEFRSFPLRTVEHCVELVAAGQGVMLFTDRDARQYPRAGTTSHRMAGPSPMARHYLLWRRADQSPLVTKFVHMVEEAGAQVSR